MKHMYSYIMVAVFGILMVGCATISNQTTQSVALTTSNGQSVTATIDGEKVTLPAEVEISRVDGAVVQVLAQDNKCYESTQLIIKGKNKVSGWFWVNAVWTWVSFSGSTTDAVSGGMWEYTNPNFIVPVEKKASCAK